MEFQDVLPFLALFLLLAVRVPIGFSLLLAGVVASAVSGETSFLSTVRMVVSAPRHYTLLAIPFFVLTAELLVAAGLIRLLLKEDSRGLAECRAAWGVLRW